MEDMGPDAAPPAEDMRPDLSEMEPDAAEMGPSSACQPACADGTVCDEATGACVDCLQDADCTEDAAPVCDPDTQTCVACLDDSTCSGDTPVCDTDAQTCVACLEDANCSGDTPVCDTDVQACVGCLESTDCSGDTPVCDTGAQTCVGCLEDADCPTAQNARCDQATLSCAPCTQASECTEAGQNQCVSGACVECTQATQDQDCATTACLPDNSCGQVERQTRTTCQSCAADDECIADHRCVPLRFQGNEYGSYCLKIASTGCVVPYSVPISRESVSGVSAEDYCGINETLTTCPAVLDYRNSESCSGDDECGADNLQDGQCETLLVGDRCTIPCTAPVINVLRAGHVMPWSRIAGELRRQNSKLCESNAGKHL